MRELYLKSCFLCAKLIIEVKLLGRWSPKCSKCQKIKCCDYAVLRRLRLVIHLIQLELFCCQIFQNMLSFEDLFIERWVRMKKFKNSWVFEDRASNRAVLFLLKYMDREIENEPNTANPCHLPLNSINSWQTSSHILSIKARLSAWWHFNSTIT